MFPVPDLTHNNNNNNNDNNKCSQIDIMRHRTITQVVIIFINSFIYSLLATDATHHITNGEEAQNDHHPLHTVQDRALNYYNNGGSAAAIKPGQRTIASHPVPSQAKTRASECNNNNRKETAIDFIPCPR